MSGKIKPVTSGDEDDEQAERAAILAVLRSRDYVAFHSVPGTRKLRARLFLVPRRGMWEWLSNGALWRMRANPDGTQIGLTYHAAAVFIEGANLLEAALAIDAHSCLFLQEHDPQRHDAPPRGQAVITSMRFFLPEGDPLDAAAKGAKH